MGSIVLRYILKHIRYWVKKNPSVETTAANNGQKKKLALKSQERCRRTRQALGAAHISRLLRAQVRYFKCRRAVCALIMEATRSRFILNFSECRKRTAGHVTKFPSCNGERSWWLLSNDKRLRSATARALWKKGESSAPSVFHTFLGAICERPLNGADPAEIQTPSYSAEVELKGMKWTPGHIFMLYYAV